MAERKESKNRSAQQNTTHIELKSQYTFDNFAIGDCNHLAHAAAQAVANKLAENYSPLFIYGGVGLGKTHLLQAIGNQIQKEAKDSHICYCNSYDFMNDLIDAIRTKKTAEFRSYYHNADILLLDEFTTVRLNLIVQL